MPRGVKGGKAKREGLKLQKDFKEEDKGQQAVLGLQDGTYKNPAQAAQALGIPKKAATIRRQAKGISKPRLGSQINLQLLTPIQEAVLAEWIKFYGFATHYMAIQSHQIRTLGTTKRAKLCQTHSGCFHPHRLDSDTRTLCHTPQVRPSDTTTSANDPKRTKRPR
ncbi:hypothetical protein B0H14DRAFT_2634961 [Mycena olivaceomarginata]|nr:hypothetical protein B0H14DRAFT_2634961 [Mycena olivaceomarginata]